MERSPVRFGPATLACLLMLVAAIASGCNALGRGKDAQSGQPAFYDEFFGQDAEAEAGPVSATEDEDAARRRFFKPNRLPGGLSPEAREIERGSFNIY
jgi:predicted small secreted protein